MYEFISISLQTIKTAPKESIRLGDRQTFPSGVNKALRGKQ